MDVRAACPEDLDAVMKIYESARRFMSRSGNPTQWGAAYPERALLVDDIGKKQCYVCTDGKGIRAVFVLRIGEDPTYTVIENGAWKNDAPYGTIHRLAGDGTTAGVTNLCIEFCRDKIRNLRADTHRDNLIMQHLLEKNGFERCGTIYVEDGSPRIAYQSAG